MAIAETGPYLPVAVEEARRIAEQFKKSRVVVLAWDPTHWLLHTTTFGVEPLDKAVAADWGRDAAILLGCDLSQNLCFSDYRIETPRKLLAVLKAMASMHGATHEGDCPEDYTCRCRFKPFNDLVNRTINEAEAAIGEVEEADWERSADDVPARVTDPVDDGSADPLYGRRMDDADLGRN